MSPSSIDARIAALESTLRRTRSLNIMLVCLGLVLAAGAFRPNTPDVLRVRGLIVVDERGRERIVIGAPLPDVKEGKRIAAGTGIVINDTAGFERFGLNLFPNGRMVLGLDAPVGTGDDRNRERLSLVADGTGGAYLRLLDRHTRAKAFLQLDDDDDVALELLQWHDDRIAVRRIGSRGDTTVTHAR
jgi:hypothetical protein